MTRHVSLPDAFQTLRAAVQDGVEAVALGRPVVAAGPPRFRPAGGSAGVVPSMNRPVARATTRLVEKTSSYRPASAAHSGGAGPPKLGRIDGVLLLAPTTRRQACRPCVRAGRRTGRSADGGRERRHRPPAPARRPVPATASCRPAPPGRTSSRSPSAACEDARRGRRLVDDPGHGLGGGLRRPCRSGAEQPAGPARDRAGTIAAGPPRWCWRNRRSPPPDRHAPTS